MGAPCAAKAALRFQNSKALARALLLQVIGSANA